MLSLSASVTASSFIPSSHPCEASPRHTLSSCNEERPHLAVVGAHHGCDYESSCTTGRYATSEFPLRSISSRTRSRTESPGSL